MQIKSIKELKAIIDVCRAGRVDSIKIGNVELKLELAAQESSPTASKEASSTPEYTDEDLLTWSSAPHG